MFQRNGVEGFCPIHKSLQGVPSMGDGYKGHPHGKWQMGRQPCPWYAKFLSPCCGPGCKSTLAVSAELTLRTLWYVLPELTAYPLRSRTPPPLQAQGSSAFPPSIQRERELVTAVSLFPFRIIFLVFCPRPTQGSPHSQMADPVTSALSPSRTLDPPPWDSSHASRAWWIAWFFSQGLSTSTPQPLARPCFYSNTSSPDFTCPPRLRFLPG